MGLTSGFQYQKTMGSQALSTHVYKSFDEFYPFYLKEHSNRTNRRLHVIGTFLGALSLIYFIVSGQFQLLFLPLLVGYGFAWVSLQF
jgi:hypothetical protein